jgi:hypothetical protein
MRVFIESKPKARDEKGKINHYEIEEDGGRNVDGKKYSTQKEAHESASKHGYHPISRARVRITDKGKPDHWRNCGYS